LRKLGLDFPGIEALDYLSIGGNYTYIDAKVNRTEFELERASDFFEVNAPDVARFDGLETSRRLFGQPKWIANADLSFRHPDWGTTLTLAFFAISDVLDAAGTTAFGPFKSVSNTLDRYVDSFYQLDLVASQKIWRGLSVKMSVKNLTNSVRRRTYDEKQLEQTVAERSGRVGRDWSFSVGYTHEF